MDKVYKNKIKRVPKHMPNPFPAFRSLYIAPSFSGKSYAINDLLTNKKYGYDKVFCPQCIFVFSPTFKSDDSYKELKKKMKGYENNIFEDINDEVLDAIIERQIEAKNRKIARPVLLLIDDLVTKLNPRKMTTLTNMFFRGRHHYISIILSSQQYKAVPKSMRLNTDSFIYFTNNMNSMEKKDCGFETPDDYFLPICKYLEDNNYNKYDFIYLNMKHDKNNRWHRCFDKQINISLL